MMPTMIQGAASPSIRPPSFGPLNRTARPRETHPLTWRLREDGHTVWLGDYRGKDGYKTARNVVQHRSAEEVCEEVREAGLKGRGGAGFLTGLKWSLTLKGAGAAPGYIVCNADEMEPNTFKDRLLMEQNPHQVLEGMIIAAHANKACKGYVFLRGEYTDAARIMKHAVAEAQAAGLLGEHALGTGRAFDIVVHTGAGRYICGEETALLNALEGKRANPRAKPPFPGQVGAWGKPTVVNNVETLSAVPSILENGARWYQGLKRPESEDHGTKLMGFTGKLRQPGLWELPLGMTAREIFEDYAGGMKEGTRLKAWQPGGASTGFLLPEDLDVPICSNALKEKGHRMGTALALAVDESVNMVALLHNIERFFARESCGWCTPCREGLPWSVKLLGALRDGHGQPGDVAQLLEISQALAPGRSFCGLAPGAAEPLASAIALFKSEFEACQSP